MSKDIRIDYPGDGAWIMERAEAPYNPAASHSIAVARDGVIVGGFVIDNFFGSAVVIHMAGDDPRWCSPETLWMLFDYVFNQLGCRRALALVRSDNARALGIDLRAGFHVEAVLHDVYPDADLMVLAMPRADCRWLRIEPRRWRRGKEVA